MTARQRVSVVFGVVLILLGILVIARTASYGGSGFAFGYLFGAGMIIVGIARLALVRWGVG